MGSAPLFINGRPASPEGYQFFVDTLKEAGVSLPGITQGSSIPHDAVFTALDQDKNQKLTQADFQQMQPGIFSDLRSVLGRYGFQLKEEMTAEVIVLPVPVSLTEDSSPKAQTPISVATPSTKPKKSVPAPQADPVKVPSSLAELYGWKPEEVEAKYQALAGRIEKQEYVKNEPESPFGEFGDGFLRGDFCQHDSWQASLGRFLGELLNPMTSVVESSDAIRTAQDDRSAKHLFWAGMSLMGTFAPLADFGKVGTHGAMEVSEEVALDGPRLWRRLRGRSAEQLLEESTAIPRHQLKLRTADEILLRENRLEIPALRTPGKPRTISGPKGRLERSEAVIKTEDLGTGSEVTETARNWIQDVWGLRNSDAGHVIGNQLGGKGSAYSNNLIPQSAKINRGQYQLWEGQVAAMVRKNGSAEVEITIHYEDEAATIPDGITYLVRSGNVTYVKWFGNAH